MVRYPEVGRKRGNALRGANPSDAYYVSAVYEHRGLGGFIRGLARR
jgi:hypothetical protein